ncbi:uncharacterized protein LOC111594028 [Drosophila hydei]|uniref:Uncharacterized protein LOC111594028 n=1 Tax=Drosophila hydei TaxID=7224 RepID=A0A6J1LCD8_DROHY|nr:uncharacterized protein LOC111594028 [Drosophila hydei]
MADELLDPMGHTIDEIRHNFEIYKLRCARLLRTNKSQDSEFQMDKELQDLRADLQELRLEMGVLHVRQSELIGWQDVNAIEELPSSINETDLLNNQQPGEAIAHSRQPQQAELEACQENQLQRENQLVISCESSPCLFDNCRMHVDNQLLLLHYLCDHNEETFASQRCHKLCEGQRVIISFDSRNCQFRQNHVIGLLAYIGSLMQKQQQQQLQEMCNSYLPQEHARLASNVPIVVLICLTASSAALQDKLITRHSLAPANANDQVFVIWLAMQQDLQLQLQLHASLNLCGRDAAVQAHTQVAVCQVQPSGGTSRSMTVDANYWRLSFSEMQKISNNFRDELHLEIVLTQLSAKSCPDF